LRVIPGKLAIPPKDGSAQAEASATWNPGKSTGFWILALAGKTIQQLQTYCEVSDH